MAFTEDMKELHRQRAAGEIDERLYRERADALLDDAIGPVDNREYRLSRSFNTKVLTGRLSQVHYFVDGLEAQVDGQRVSFSSSWHDPPNTMTEGDEVVLCVARHNPKLILTGRNLTKNFEDGPAIRTFFLATFTLALICACLEAGAALTLGQPGGWLERLCLAISSGALGLTFGILAGIAGAAGLFYKRCRASLPSRPLSLTRGASERSVLKLVPALDQLRQQLLTGALSHGDYRRKVAEAFDNLVEPCGRRSGWRGRRALLAGVVTEVRPQRDSVLALVDGHLIWISLPDGAKALRTGDRVRVSGHHSPAGLFVFALQNETQGYNCESEVRFAVVVLCITLAVAIGAAIAAATAYSTLSYPFGPAWLRIASAAGCATVAISLAPFALGMAWLDARVWNHIHALRRC